MVGSLSLVGPTSKYYKEEFLLITFLAMHEPYSCLCILHSFVVIAVVVVEYWTLNIIM